MHGHPGRFVDGQQVCIFKQDRKLAARRRADGLIGRLAGQPERRQAHLVAGLHPAFRTAPPLVDAHLAAADDAVDMGFGHPLEVPQKEVVQTLPA